MNVWSYVTSRLNKTTKKRERGSMKIHMHQLYTSVKKWGESGRANIA